MKRIKGEVLLATVIVLLVGAFAGVVASQGGQKAPETPATVNYR